MASNGEDRANSPESESSRLEYNRPVTAEAFRFAGIPDHAALLEMLNVNEGDRTWRLLRLDGATANEILAENEYAIRGRIIETVSNGGEGANFVSPRTGPHLARRFLIELWRLKRDVTKSTMTHREVYLSNIGRTLSAFKEEMKVKMREAESYLAQLLLAATRDNISRTNILSYENNIAFHATAIEDIDRISRLLVEFANENNGWTTEDLGLPEGEPVDDDDGNDDEDEEEEVYGFVEDEPYFEPNF
jgi:hypothetical protein